MSSALYIHCYSRAGGNPERAFHAPVLRWIPELRSASPHLSGMTMLWVGV